MNNLDNNKIKLEDKQILKIGKKFYQVRFIPIENDDLLLNKYQDFSKENHDNLIIDQALYIFSDDTVCVSFGNPSTKGMGAVIHSDHYYKIIECKKPQDYD